MKTWHPESYSQQARRLAQEKIRQFEEAEIESNDLVRYVQFACQAPLVKKRLAKMIYRYLHKNHIKVTMGLKEAEAWMIV